MTFYMTVTYVCEKHPWHFLCTHLLELIEGDDIIKFTMYCMNMIQLPHSTKKSDRPLSLSLRVLYNPYFHNQYLADPSSDNIYCILQ